MEGSGYKLTFDQDYHEVCQSLRNLHRRGDLIALGIAFGLSYQTVQGMGNGDDFLSQIVAAWLKQQDNVLSQSGEPTWSVLVDKLEEIGCTEIVADIQRKHKGPQHKGESEQQQDGNPPTLSTDLSDSLMDKQQSHSSLSEKSHVSGCSTVVQISTQSVTLSEQDQSHIREQSDNQQLSCATSTEGLKQSVTHTYTLGQLFSPDVTVPTVIAKSSQTQPTERYGLQSALSVQALNPSLPLPPTSTSSHHTTSPSVAQSSYIHPKALPSTEDLSGLIKAEEAGEAFRECRADLVVAVVDPLILANHLYSKKVISRATLEQITELSLTISIKNIILLNAIEARIRTHPSDFLVLLAILENDAHLCVHAEGLRNSYCLLCTQSSLEAQATNVSATMKMNMYLMNYYKCSQVSLDTKYPHIQEKVYINLAIIEKEQLLVNRSNADKFTKGTLYGHADEILKDKKPIELKAVLEPPDGQKSMKCVFVEGAPGVGKSTFALEICRQQEDVRAFSLVVLLRLREKRVQEIQNVTELFYHENTDLQQAVTKEVTTCEGENVLLVLDGFDELPTDLQKRSFIVELIQGKHLPKCTVLVTSRPSATADLHFTCKSQIHKHIEILGFTHERIQQYAESTLSDQPDVLQDFLKYISNNPAIHGMMYIPLNSAIVLEIYKANRTIGKPVPCTMTQLYTELCLVLLRKYLVESNNPLAEQLQGRLEDIPPKLKDKILKLGKLALEGALQQKIIFEQLPNGCVDLGFMNVTTEFYLGRKSVVSYSFLHLTLQEFLAAFYVSQLPSVEQKLIFIENMLIYRNKSVPKFINSKSHLDVLWRFMAGLTGFKDIGWKLINEATQVIMKPRCIHQQLLFVHCLLETQCEQIIKTTCDAIMKEYITKDVARYVINYAAKPSSGFNVTDASTPFDCYALGYCVAASGHVWSLDLENIGGNEIIEMLSCGVQAVGDVCGCFRILLLAKNSLTHKAITYLNKFPIKLLKQITVLDLSNNELNKDALDCLASTLSDMTNLNVLDVSRNPGSPGGLLQGLLNSGIVKDLSIHEIDLDPSDITVLSQLIAPTANLIKLKVGSKNMSSECIALLIETLLSVSSLVILELWRINYTPENASKLKLLENNTNLASLRIVNSFSGINFALPFVAKALHKNKALRLFGIICVTRTFDRTQYIISFGDTSTCYDYEIGADSVKMLSEMLMVNGTLTTLEITTNLFTRDDLFTLSDALKHNHTLRYLRLVDRVMNTLTVDQRIRHWHPSLYYRQYFE